MHGILCSCLCQKAYKSMLHYLCIMFYALTHWLTCFTECIRKTPKKRLIAFASRSVLQSPLQKFMPSSRRRKRQKSPCGTAELYLSVDTKSAMSHHTSSTMPRSVVLVADLQQVKTVLSQDQPYAKSSIESMDGFF